MSIKPTDRKARSNYKAKVKRFTVDFYPTENDLIEQIEKQPKKQSYIKELIRKDIMEKLQDPNLPASEKEELMERLYDDIDIKGDSKTITYEISFNALNTKGETVGMATLTITTDRPLDLEDKPLGFQRLCVEYARLIGISCSFAEIVEVKSGCTTQE